jgi:hypothetical protein
MKQDFVEKIYTKNQLFGSNMTNTLFPTTGSNKILVAKPQTNEPVSPGFFHGFPQ